MDLVKKNFSRTKIFWIMFFCLSVSGIFFSLRFFSKAFPIVDLDITMDRHQALAKAHDLALQLKLKPEQYKQATSFDNESDVQNYIELEAGGPEKFGKLLKEGIYSPYFWKVRHFKEYDAHETELFFTPQGKPYGFVQKVAEDEPGKALTSQEAQKIAINEAQSQWQIDFSPYKLIEAGLETTSQGRNDHTFVFERTDKKIGEAPYRLKLVVKGDRLTELKHSIKVPDRFTRKYQEMRSSNNFIAFMALIVMILFYIFLGCFLGLFFLIKWSWIEIKWPFFWALLISTLQALNEINHMPFYWFEYDTAISKYQFIGYIALQIVYHFCTYFAASFLLITIAEGLTRKAFASKIQLWKMWSPLGGSSIQVLGRTLGGYLLLGIDMAFSIGFYYLALKFLGWWSPSNVLYDPNALAAYFPWISPLASSLSAGFLEECLFRAIPLAGAALLGDRLGKRNLFIVIAFIVQALVFGAAHANYPAQPAYARLIELIIPSFVFGGTYLLYGLLPAIISHVIFDVVWFSLPIFISQGSSSLFDKCMIIVCCLLPLLFVLYRRFQQKKWIELPSYFYNSAWHPWYVFQNQNHVHEPLKIYWSKQKNIKILAVGIFSIGLWFFTSRFDFDTVPLRLNRTQAISAAKKSSINTVNHWSYLTNIEVPLDSKDRNQHMYIWRTYGPKLYKKFLNNYLMPAVFKVRLVHFEGSTEERSEEYELFIEDNTNNTLLRRFHHQYPEITSLESLAKEGALNVAYSYILENYALDKDHISLISALPIQRPNRLDWKFLFNDLQQHLGAAQARITIEIAGKNVVEAYRSIFVPEQWDRSFKDEVAFSSLLDICKLLLFIFLIGCASLILLVASRSYLFSMKMFWVITSLLLLKSTIQALNIWPIATAIFNTSEPFSYQAWHVILFWVVYALFIAFGYGIVIGFLHNKWFKSPQADTSFLNYVVVGIALGMVQLGYRSLVAFLVTPLNPQWPVLTYTAAYLPWLSQTLSMFSNYIETTMLAIIIFTAVDYVYEYYSHLRWILIPFLMGFGIVMFDVRDFTPAWWLFIVGGMWGIIMWVVYLYGVRHFRASLPCIIATIKIFGVIPAVVFLAYPDIVVGSAMGALCIGALAVWWSYQLYAGSR